VKQVPLRRCLVSGETLPKKDMLRIVKTPEGALKVDPTGKLNGHGGYIKKDVAVLEIAIKKHILEKTFAMAVAPELYEEIRRYL